MVREKDVGFVRDVEVVHFVAVLQNGSDLLEEDPWVDDDAVTDDRFAAFIKDAAWKKMEGVSDTIYFD